jgi:hypothetical protein
MTEADLRALENALHAERQSRGGKPAMSRNALDVLVASLD